MKTANIFWIVIMVTALFSCSDNSLDEVVDKADNGIQNEVTLTLTLDVDGVVGRAVADDEQIKNAYISISGEAVEGNPIYILHPQDGTAKTVKVTRLIAGKKVNIEVWANTNKADGATEAQLENENSVNGLSMYGKLTHTVSTTDSENNVNVSLYRNVANILFNNQLGSDTKLKVTGVYLVNAKNTTNITPGADNSTEKLSAGYYDGWGYDKSGTYKQTNGTENKTFLAETAKNDGVVTSASFYAYENTYSETYNHTLLIVEGYWDNSLEKTYYRIDVGDGIKKMVRNTKYTINLIEAVGPGTDDPFNDTKAGSLKFSSSLEGWSTGTDIDGGELE